MTRVAARGLTFDVRVGGPADGVPVLLLHGFPQHSGEWDDVLPALHEAGLRSYALDQRGYSPGARPAEVSAYRLSECVADVLAVLDELGVGSIHLVGHDWGALVAWHLATGDRVRTLTAISVPHPRAMTEAITGDPEQRRKSAYVAFFRRSDGEPERALLADDGAMLRQVLAGVGDEERIDRYVRLMREPGALTAALNWYRALSGPGFGDVDPVGVPTTFVWSDNDLAVGRTAAEACAAQVTGDYRFVELAGVTHWIPDEAPTAVAEAVLARIRAESPLDGTSNEPRVSPG